MFLPLVLCLPTFVCILFLHESPDWLRKKGRLVQYKQSMAFYQKCQVYLYLLMRNMAIFFMLCDYFI